MAKTAEQLEKIHKQALDRFEKIENREREQRRLAVEDRRFVNSETGQWDEDAIAKRADRPRYTINRVAGAIDQLIGDQRQNQTSIKVIPESGKANKETADIFSGLIRNIESTSKAGDSYDNAYDETVGGGFGGWRVLTEFNDDDIFVQDAKIEGIPSADTSLFFGPSKRYDKRDASHAFLISNMPKDEFEDEFPDAGINEWPSEQYSAQNCTNWFSDDSIRIAEYWVKEPVTKKIGLLSDGRVIDMDDEEAALDELEQQGITVIKERSVKSHKVVMYKMNGAEILEGPMDWAGKFIPLVPVFGKVSHIENDTFVRGVTRFAKDPAKIYNYTISNNIEATALTPKDPLWYDPRQAEGFKSQYENFNKQNSPFMPYNSIPTVNNGGPPVRGGAPAIQTALIEQARQASEDIFFTTNMGPPSVGMNPGLQSGVALQRQDEKGDRSAFIYQDNLQKSIEYTGEILVDLIPKIYDTPRMIRVLNIDDSTEIVGINQEDLDNVNQTVIDEETKEPVIVNDLTVGKYSVKTSSGPAFTTMRQESASQLIDLAVGNEEFMSLSMDLIAKNIDVIDGDELTKRVRRKMILEQRVEPTEDEIKEMGLDQEQPVDTAKQALEDNVNMQTTDLMSQIEKRDADRDNVLAKTQTEIMNTLKTLMEAFETQSKAGIPFSDQEHDVRVKQLDITGEEQQEVDPGPNSEQARDIIENNLQSQP